MAGDERKGIGMGGGAKQFRELEALSGKVHQATELISRLKKSNQKLSDELETIKRRLDLQEAGPSSEAAEPIEKPMAAAPEPDPTLMEEVKRLRRERVEIRERVSRLLQQIDSLEI